MAPMDIAQVLNRKAKAVWSFMSKIYKSVKLARPGGRIAGIYIMEYDKLIYEDRKKFGHTEAGPAADDEIFKDVQWKDFHQTWVGQSEEFKSRHPEYVCENEDEQDEPEGGLQEDDDKTDSPEQDEEEGGVEEDDDETGSPEQVLISKV
ncbi:hypothetical protein N0V82_004820 [Gnomoniopsis sp. IMI 355080]|nr:hypothetical protein N0V82_004820 [Gnomoniopsis sp. IMI 355080]